MSTTGPSAEAFADTPYPGDDALVRSAGDEPDEVVDSYLMADLDRKLMYTDPLFYLYFGLDQKTRTQSVNVPGRGASTWWAVQQEHFAGFTPREAAAIVTYLRWRTAQDEPEFSRRSVHEALESYWLPKAGAENEE